MMDEVSTDELGMTNATTYQITVNGKLTEHWEEWFERTTMRFARGTTGRPHTILTCKVQDQAELLGVLTKLNQLNLPLLKVSWVGDASES